MRLNRLSLTNFRAFSRLEMDLPGRILVLVGDNAQGKTSLMEAVYYLATFASFQAGTERQMINFDAVTEPLAVARIVAEYERGGQSHRLEVRIIQEPVLPAGSRTRKEILLDGVKKSAAEAVGQFSAVIFLAADDAHHRRQPGRPAKVPEHGALPGCSRLRPRVERLYAGDHPAQRVVEDAG